nr:unnamed protein product [Callosobruchus analis]
MIAKQKKPDTIATQIILGEDAEQKIRSISLLNNTVKRRIDDTSKIIAIFAISSDESTDIVNCAQFIVYVRYIQSLTAGTTSEDIFNSISNLVEKNNLDWNKLIGLARMAHLQ